MIFQKMNFNQKYILNQLKQKEYYKYNFLFNIYEYSLFYGIIYTVVFFIASFFHQDLFFVWLTGVLCSLVYSTNNYFDDKTPFISFILFSLTTSILCLVVSFIVNILDQTILIGGLITIPLAFHAVLFKSLPNKKEKHDQIQHQLIEKIVIPELTEEQRNFYHQYQLEIKKELLQRIDKYPSSNEMIQRCETIKNKKNMNKEFTFSFNFLCKKKKKHLKHLTSPLYPLENDSDN